MSNDGFLERWSRRKLARDEPEAPAEAGAAPEGDALEEESPEEESLDEAELARLPSLDSFTVKTDLSAFLRKGVPQAMRNAAMRRMWMLDPAVRDHVDFAVDYAWDWNTPGGVPGNAGSISQESVARMMDALNPKPKAAEVAPAPEVASTTEAKEPVASAPEGEQSEPDATAQPVSEADEQNVAEAPQASPADDPPPRPRRHGGAAPV